MLDQIQISNGHLAAVIGMLLTQPRSGEIRTVGQFTGFMTDLAKVVCDYCGGEVIDNAEHTGLSSQGLFPRQYQLAVQPNDSSPDGGGVWEKSATWSRSLVPVKYWDCYGSEYPTTNTHQFDVDDQRVSNGQLFVDLGALNGNVDDMLGVTIEVNTNPLNGSDHVPCAHIHFDGDNLAVSLFKVGNRILIRPETDVSIESFRGTGIEVPETMFWIDSPHVVRTEDDEQSQRRIERDNQNKRNIFVEAMQSKYLSTSGSPLEEIRIRRDLVAQEVLGTYASDTVISRELYDADSLLGECLLAIHQGFEFPSWEGRTVGEFLAKHGVAGEPVCMNVLQYSTPTANKDGIHADNVSLQELWDAPPLGETGWLLPSGMELWFHNTQAEV